MTNHRVVIAALLSTLCLAAAGCVVDGGEVDEENEVDEAGDEPDVPGTIAYTYTTCDFGAIYGDCSCSYFDSSGKGNVIEDDEIRGSYYELYQKRGSRTTQVQGRVRCTKGSTSYLKYGSWVTGRAQVTCPNNYKVSNTRCRVRVRH